MTVTETPRLRLLESAITVFSEKGFAAAPVRDICRLAGTNIAAINYYFGDKQRLYVEAIKHAHSCMISQVPMPPLPPDTPALQRLKVFMEVMVGRMVREPNPHVTQLIMRELA